MKVLLDTNFILSCIRKKIDFISQLEEQGFSIALPIEVLQELKDLRKKYSESHKEKMEIDLALDLFQKKKIKKLTLAKRANKQKVDEMLITKGKHGYYIATLDNAIKRAVPNKIIIFNARKSIGILRK